MHSPHFLWIWRRDEFYTAKILDERVYPASTTKIMTAILALEMGNMDDTVTATYDALKSITLEDSHMGILTGEELTLDQLVKGMLVYSANDAANVIAIHIAGSLDAFVDLMNQRHRNRNDRHTLRKSLRFT